MVLSLVLKSGVFSVLWSDIYILLKEHFSSLIDVIVLKHSFILNIYVVDAFSKASQRCSQLQQKEVSLFMNHVCVVVSWS